MNFGFSEEQDLLRAEVRKFLLEQCPTEEVRRIAGTAEGHSPELWKQLAELGWLGLTLPERYGGADLTWIDLVVLLEEVGRALVPAPLISTTLAGSAILTEGSEDQKARWLPGLADGSRIGTLALLEKSDQPTTDGIHLRGERTGDGFVLRGDKRFVSDPDQADLFVIAFRAGDGPEDLTLAVVERDAPGLRTQAFETMDKTKRLGNVQFGGVRVSNDAILGEVGKAAGAIARLLDRGAIAVTAEAVGAAERLHELTVQYAKDRIQFGQPIGHFQGVKHPLADMLVQVESSKSLLYYAAWALDGEPEEVPRAVSLAKAYASEAFIRIGIDSIIFHGAYGYTEDCDVQLYFKRSKWARPNFGDADYHYDRVATLRGL
jgi:alkylation response protein AidB-like acyl-CoA dehydrogenase